MEDNNISKYTLESILMHFSKITKSLIITIVIIVILWFATIGVFIWYSSLPVEEVTSTEQVAEDIELSTLNQTIGDSYGESITKDK